MLASRLLQVLVAQWREVGKAFSSKNQVNTDPVNAVLDANEKAHLVFLREEEKLARDVYLKLGEMYPNSRIFGKIDDSEQKHTTAVKNMIEKYGLEDP